MFSRLFAPRLVATGLRANLFTARTFSTSTLLRQELATTTEKVFANVHQPQSTDKTAELIHKYILYCNFGKNNTHLTLTALTEDLHFLKKNPDLSWNEKVLYYYRLPQKVKLSVSSGQLGFRKSARGEYEAGFQTAAKMFSLMEERGFLDKNVEIVVKNFGKGREAFVDALNGKEGNHVRPKITRLSDNTKLKFGGTKSPKVRRL